MTLYRDQAIVLRTQKLGEADRIVALLTRRHGRVRAVVKGVRRTRSRFGARLEPFSHVDLQLYAGRQLDIVTQAESLTAFGASIVADYPSYTAGTAMLETAERLTAEEREPSLRLYLLLVGGLRALAAREHPAPLVLDSFVLRALTVAGYQPSLDDCAGCGATGPHRAFAVGGGGMVCPECRPAGSATPSALAVALLAAVHGGDWGAADTSAPSERREVSGLVAAYLQWHLEQGMRSLRHVEREHAIQAPTPAPLPGDMSPAT